MFYVPELHYCDQLTTSKEIRPELKAELPDYLFVEKAEPEVVVVPGLFARWALDELEERFGRDAYRPAVTIPGPWYYVSKPELYSHTFQRPVQDRRRFSGMVVLVRRSSPLARRSVLQPEARDAATYYQLGLVWTFADRMDDALEYFATAMYYDKGYVHACLDLADTLAAENATDKATAIYLTVLRANADSEQEDAGGARVGVRDLVNLGNLCMQQHSPHLAVPYYRAVVQFEPTNLPARVGLGVALVKLGKTEEAIAAFRQALEIDPELALAHVYLGDVLVSEGRFGEALAYYQAALPLVAEDLDLTERVRRAIRRCQSRRKGQGDAHGAETGP
jgi:tetratricopeptide (TPR) repeat protein